MQRAITPEPRRACERAAQGARIAGAGLALLLLLAATSSCGRKSTAQPIDYSSSNEVSITFGEVTRNDGIRQARVDHDGTTVPATIGGLNGHRGKAGAWNAGYIYFIVDPTFKRTDCRRVKVSVYYYDSAPGRFELQYDGFDPAGPGNGSYTVCPKQVALSGSQEWALEEFVLRDPRFQNSQNGNADFRIHFKASEFHLSSVAVARLP